MKNLAWCRTGLALALACRASARYVPDRADRWRGRDPHGLPMILISSTSWAGPVGLALVAVQAPSPTPSPNATRLVLEVRGLDPQALRGALELRVSSAFIDDAWQPLDTKRPQVFIRVRRADEGRPVLVEVVTSDGRGFVRVLSADSADEREVATAIASLLVAIDNGEAAADLDTFGTVAEGSPDPQGALLELSKLADQKLAAADSSLRGTEGGDVGPADRGTAEDPSPGPAAFDEPSGHEGGSIPGARAPDGSPAPSAWTAELGASAGVMLVGGPPVYTAPYAGGGGSLFVDIHARSGGTVGLSFRGNFAARESTFLSRYAVSVRGGYLFRRKRVSVSTLALLSVEPWRIGDGSGGNLRVQNESTVSPVFRAGVRIAPGLAIPLNRSRLESVSVFLDTEFSGGFVLQDGRPVVLGIHYETPDTSTNLHRLGGFESFVGLGASLSFGLASSRRPSEP